MRRLLLLLLIAPSMALAETGAGETLPSTADLFSWSYLGQVMASLALVIGLLFGALWIMRRVNGVGQAVGGQMRVISSLSLGQRERAVGIRCIGDGQFRHACRQSQRRLAGRLGPGGRQRRVCAR